jgi:hypothetical protein
VLFFGCIVGRRPKRSLCRRNLLADSCYAAALDAERNQQQARLSGLAAE